MAGSEENWYLEIVMETVAEIDILNVLSHFVLDCPNSFWRIMQSLKRAEMYLKSSLNP